MLSFFKKKARKSIDYAVKILGKFSVGRYIETAIISSAMNRVVQIKHENLTLKFVAPNPLCNWRYKTFSIKEPETLEWIDSIDPKSVLWDIGANIGLYSIYAAIKKDCMVWAFEPSVFNLETLARNIYMNNLTDQICIVPMPLSDSLCSSRMQLTTTEWGGALSTFGQKFGWDGNKIQKIFEFHTIGLSMEDAVNNLLIPIPEYIKMVVDGLEHFILRGGMNVLKKTREILIEVNDDFHEQAEQTYALLSSAGLIMREKRHAVDMEYSAEGKNCFNQIWSRPVGSSH